MVVTDSDPVTDSLFVSAIDRNIPLNGGIEFLLDGVRSSGILSEPYEFGFTEVSSGDHIVEATIFDGADVELTSSFAIDMNEQIGVNGKVFVAIGDSIWQGALDDISGDNESSDGRNKSRGFTPILNDSLENCLQQPVIVYNEGLGGTFSYEGDGRLISTIDRYPKADYWLILFGTNDALTTLFTPSGVDCTEAKFDLEDPDYDPSCSDTYKGYLRNMILELKSRGKTPMLAKVPYSSVVSPIEDARIQEYNSVIEQLWSDHNLRVRPDLYTHFMLNQNELADGIHPTGQGYISIADKWFNEFTNPDPQYGLFTCQ